MMTDVAPALQPARTRRRIGELLVDEGIIDHTQLQHALTEAQVVNGKKERLGHTIVRLNLATEVDIARALARQLHLDYFDGAVIPVNDTLAAQIPSQLAERNSLLPLRMEPDGTIVVICADPTNVVAFDDVRLASKARRVRPIVAPQSLLEAAIRKAYGFDQRAGELLDAIDDRRVEEGAADLDFTTGVEDAPVIRLAEGILGDAVEARASDIHVEPGREDTAVRYRIDGVLHNTMTVPRSATGALISRLKLMAGMDIAERRRPQDGRARFKSKAAEVDLRVSTLPSMHGETIVLRILRKGAEQLAISDVGFTPHQLQQVLNVIERPQGLVLITGPTGAGKTSTLYSFLGHLAGEKHNIITVEDPVEYELSEVNQTQVHERIDFTFAKALRTVLRQDPDIVMVGEIRDPETAELALQASLTGHLVFSTLHTNDAPSAVVRLRDLGIPSYLIASSLTMVIGQRLGRSVCSGCAEPDRPDDRTMAALHIGPKDLQAGNYRRGAGCPRCNHTGYLGRTGIFEILTVDSKVREQIASQSSESGLRTAARRSGMSTLREDAMDKAAAGLTSLEEVLRTTTTDLVDAGACPVCAQNVNDDFSLCPWCGVDLRPHSCAECLRHLEMGWKVCPSCGTPTGNGAPKDRNAKPVLMVVDADPSVRAAVAVMADADYKVIGAEDGRAALEAVHHTPPDAVLVAVDLPDMDGYNVTRELRARPVTADLPVVLMTDAEGEDVAQQGLRAGADDHIVKPLDADDLLARLDVVRRRLAK
jgi:type II secretory ATPase GspE/PulE/Tfp pilus assembly ATPase PilB-like protein/ActR/RegA family two-component response regulator/RNA polymerase subunit RPABC4/transcription elongation factor Spt4